MRLLLLSKRRPQQRDLIERPYGRFYHLPVALAALGHEVRVVLVGHHGQLSGERDFAGVRWRHHDLRTLGPAKLDRAIGAEVEDFTPDWLIGCSDAWFGWLAHRWARRSGARLGIDAYDNYEAYMPWNLPLHGLWRRALAAADLVTAAGPQLAALLSQSRPWREPARVLPMAPDPMFRPEDKAHCRDLLGLATDAPLFGYAGGWAATRGTELLINAFARVRRELPQAQLVLTGRPPAKALATEGVLGLGYLDDAQMPAAISAVDVSCVVIADSAFGRYSYPAKLCETMACGTPVVASATGPTRWMLANDELHLAPCGNAADHAKRMLALYRAPSADYPVQQTWRQLAARWSDWLSEPR